MKHPASGGSCEVKLENLRPSIGELVKAFVSWKKVSSYWWNAQAELIGFAKKNDGQQWHPKRFPLSKVFLKPKSGKIAGEDCSEPLRELGINQKEICHTWKSLKINGKEEKDWFNKKASGFYNRWYSFRESHFGICRRNGVTQVYNVALYSREKRNAVAWVVIPAWHPGAIHSM